MPGVIRDGRECVGGVLQCGVQSASAHAPAWVLAGRRPHVAGKVL
jgi:hypothetical protein